MLLTLMVLVPERVLYLNFPFPIAIHIEKEENIPQIRQNEIVIPIMTLMWKFMMKMQILIGS